MAYPQGINFRSTLGYVTDGANENFEAAGGVTYPRTTAQGNTVGWEQSVGNTRDRNSALDRRLAGVHFFNTQTDFRFDLPSAGSYSVRLAAGDASNGNDTVWSLLDTTTVLQSLATGTSTAGNFKDATDTLLSAAAWPGSNTAVTKTFSTTICRFRGATVGVANQIAHAYVESAGGASNTAINPGVGSVAITGHVPTVAQTANQSLTPSAGSIGITGYAPTISQPQSITAGGGTISITGYAPTITQGITTSIVPGVGALAITGYAPSIAQSANQFVAPGVGALTLSGYAPTLAQTANQAILPGAGVLVVTGYAPTVTQASSSPNLTPGAGQLTITGYEPTVTQSGGAGRPKRKPFQVETSRGVLEVDTLDEVADIVRAEKRRPKAAPVEVKLGGIKVSTPSLKPQIDYKAIEARMRAEVQAEMDDEEELLMMLL